MLGIEKQETLILNLKVLQNDLFHMIYAFFVIILQFNVTIT